MIKKVYSRFHLRSREASDSVIRCSHYTCYITISSTYINNYL